MAEERDAADRIKQRKRILVVIGNPPYNGFAGRPVEEEAGLVEPYRTTKTAPKPQGQGLNDLYVRFFRLAARCITERGIQHGIVCYISNYSWLDGLSHTGLRDHPHLFHHTIAILHAPSYATENAPALRQDWPRVPLPAEREQLLASAELGRHVAALLDPEAKVAGVTSGKLSAALKLIGQPTKVGGGNFSDEDYAVAARWGIAGKGGITMPGKGRVRSRPFDAAERIALGDQTSEVSSCGRSPDRATASDRRSPDTLSILGEETCDIFLNDKAHWKNVPRPVWKYTLGGYQVLKKWLSYREQTLLGRPLTVDEVTYFRDVIRRITALLMLGQALDANYSATKATTYAWPPTGDERANEAVSDQGRVPRAR